MDEDDENQHLLTSPLERHTASVTSETSPLMTSVSSSSGSLLQLSGGGTGAGPYSRTALLMSSSLSSSSTSASSAAVTTSSTTYSSQGTLPITALLLSSNRNNGNGNGSGNGVGNGNGTGRMGGGYGALSEDARSGAGLSRTAYRQQSDATDTLAYSGTPPFSPKMSEGALGDSKGSTPLPPSDAMSDLEFIQQYVSVHHPPDRGTSEDNTTIALQQCQKIVVAPVTWLLTFLAWRPFSAVQSKWTRRITSALYFLFFLMLIFYNYVYDIVVCYQIPDICANLISKFIVPDVIHLSSYLYGLYYFRKHSGFDDNIVLIETVFLQSTTGSHRTLFGDLSQAQLVRTLRMYIGAGASWLIIRVTYNLVKYAVVQTSTFDTGVRSMTTILMVVATFAADCVYVVIVLCYAMQCRLLLFYIDGLRNRMNQRQHTLSAATKELIQIQRFVKTMNNGLGKVVSISVFMFTILTVSPFVTLLDKPTISSYSTVHKIVVLCELFVWVLMLGTTLAQAARLTAKCLSIKDMAIIVRNEGYRNASQAELDSFMVFAANLRMGAKVFAMTITAGFIARIVFIAGVTIIMLFQVGAIELWIGA